MNQSLWLLVLITSYLFGVVIADDDKITCDKDNSCPEDKPCCSQYGECGTGAYCLGGCDIRFSFSLDSCMPMPMMEDYESDFKDPDIFEKQYEYLGNSSETDWLYTGYIDTSDDAILLQMPNGSTGTVISSTKYLWYGKISATMKSSRDKGVITAFILFSDVQDEIDYEFVGYDLTHPQSNYYAQGILDYTNSENTTVSDTFENWHDYEIDWNPDRIEWSIDGKKVRTLKKEDTWNKTKETYDYPQTPSRVQVSLWPGGDSRNGLGTIEWAGGKINWDSTDIQEYGYYYAFIKNLKIETYDLPEDVEKVEADDDEAVGDGYNAFLYNSTNGKAKNIYLTNRKTWLGSADATGMDPENESDDESDHETHTETLVSGSGSEAVTKTKTSTSTPEKTASVDIPNQGGAGGHAGQNNDSDDEETTTTTDTYNPSAGIGGFQQDTQNTSTDSSSSSGSRMSFEGILGIIITIGAGVFSFL